MFATAALSERSRAVAAVPGCAVLRCAVLCVLRHAALWCALPSGRLWACSSARMPSLCLDHFHVQITMALSNPQSTGYASNIEAQYSGQRLKWQFQPAA